MGKYTSPYYHLVYCWKYPSSVIELPTRGLSWCVYTSDCPQPVNWSVWTSWVKIKMRWTGLGEDHRKWEGPPLLLYKRVFSASGDILKTLVVVVVQSCPTLCDPMDCSMPILHCLPEFTQTCSLSQWCHPTISSSVTPFSSALSLSQHQGLFQ